MHACILCVEPIICRRNRNCLFRDFLAESPFHKPRVDMRGMVRGDDEIHMLCGTFALALNICVKDICIQPVS